jgi:hypothetical protein
VSEVHAYAVVLEDKQLILRRSSALAILADHLEVPPLFGGLRLSGGQR